MTVDECMRRIKQLSADRTPVSDDLIRDDLRALLYTESERAAVMLRETANSDEVTSMCCSDDTGNLLDALAANILRTSPGKAGG